MSKDRRQCTVLIVEDDEAFSYAASHYLRSIGYKVIEAFGSIAALKELEKGRIDIVVTDVSLNPNEPHGVSLGRMAAFKRPGLPILFITGRRELIELAGDLPGDVLFKPVELEVLARKIGELLAR